MRAACAWLVMATAIFACTGGPLSCTGCGSSSLAELIDAKGMVERDLLASVGQWKAAEPGASFEAGDGLRTAPNATAMLRVGRKGRVHVESDTTIRFSRGAKQAAALSNTVAAEAPTALVVERGEARIEAGEEPLTLQTELGKAVLRAGGSMAVARADSGTRYRVLVGGASFDAKDGQSKQLAQGESIVIGLGVAVLEAMPTKQAAALLTAEATRAVAQTASPDAAVTTPEPTEAAVTATIKGSVRRRGADDEAWAALAQGTAQLGADDELDVGAAAQASLQRGDERAVLSAGRYQVGDADAPLVRAIEGEVALESSAGQSVRIAVPGGTITAVAIAGGTRARVAVRGADGHTDIRVERGQVKAVNADVQLALGQGERGELAARADAPATVAPIERAELIVPAGEFFRVYDPKPPTAIGFKVGKACGARGAEVRVEGSAPVRGRDQVNVSVGPGIHDYAVHCLEGSEPAAKAALRTKLRIVRNDGARKLPMTPPKNDVSLDGRRYTLMYQNLKPILTAKWRDAPKATGYVLHITPPRGATLSLRTSQPQLVIPADALKDGTHRIQFETVGKSKLASKETLVDIMFDNAAPTASLELPHANGFSRAESVSVAGVAVEGSRVSVAGTTLALDDQQRFRGEVPLPSDERALAVRVQHPRHGIRYYLRRVSNR